MSPPSLDSEEPLADQWLANGQPHHHHQIRPDPPSKPRRFSLQPLFKWGKFHLRAFDDDGDEDWWFASTAIPLLAATIGPLANVLSIAALVVFWRANRLPGDADACLAYDGNPSTLLPDLQAVSYRDPDWCYRLNIVSLVFGFVGNLFLLANFTNRIRYIVALPVTIVLWFLATAILVGITIAMHVYAPPVPPCQTYTQGFWYAVIAAVLYFACSALLLVNMLGYFLGHYPQRFTLTEAQRTLILQTMMFFLWLAGGAGVFSRVEQDIGGQGWLFTDALYFCDVTILTVGFGDLTPNDDVGRGLVFPYSVGGIIMLGLMVSSLTTFVGDLSSEKVVRKHLNSRRRRTFERSTSLQQEMFDAQPKNFAHPPVISSPRDGRRMRESNQLQIPSHTLLEKDVYDAEMSTTPTTVTPSTPIDVDATPPPSPILRRLTHRNTIKIASAPRPPHLNTHKRQKARTKALRLQLLHKEKDRFDAMRRIERNAASFKGYTALLSSVLAFCILWLAGAAVFHATESQTLGLTYFQSLYFCYVSLLTIGYGDFAPKSNAGRPFFVVWSLLAVPAMTILVSHLGATLIASFTRATDAVADFTVLPKYGVWRGFLDRHPWLLGKLQSRAERKARAKRLEEGFATGPDPDAPEASIDDGGVSAVHAPSTLGELAASEDVDAALSPLAREGHLATRLAAAIRRTAQDLAAPGAADRKYSYEEWVEITALIRFTSRRRLHERGYPQAPLEEVEEEGLVQWDWIGEDSPMMAGSSEPKFVMERLCESLGRFVAAQVRRDGRPLKTHGAKRRHHGLGEEGGSEVEPDTPVERRWKGALEEEAEEKAGQDDAKKAGL